MDPRSTITQALMRRRPQQPGGPQPMQQPNMVPVIGHNQMSTIPAGAGTAAFDQSFRAGSGGYYQQQAPAGMSALDPSNWNTSLPSGGWGY